MKNFIYRAKEGPEKTVEGKMLANDTQEVVDRLARDGLVATYVKDEKDGLRDSSRYSLRGIFGFGIRLKDIIVFSRQLSKLLASGIPVLRSLTILSEQTQNGYFRSVIDDISEKVKNGQTMSASIKDYPKIFSPFYIAMVKAGEDSGGVDRALNRISECYKRQYELIYKVKAALAYPILILLVGIATLIFIFTNVIPRIIPILLSLRVSLPLPTKILIAMSSFAKNNWSWFLVWTLILILIFK
ncbi:type II secretion system F family protein, partial [Thermoproteota archaeon]